MAFILVLLLGYLYINTGRGFLYYHKDMHDGESYITSLEEFGFIFFWPVVILFVAMIFGLIVVFADIVYVLEVIRNIKKHSSQIFPKYYDLPYDSDK